MLRFYVRAFVKLFDMDAQQQALPTQELNDAWADYTVGREDAIPWEQVKSQLLVPSNDDAGNQSYVHD